MTAALLGLAWVAVVASGARRARRARPPRLAELRASAPRRRLILPPLVLPVFTARRLARRRARALETELPEIVDLLSLAVGAGLTVPLAVDAVARRATGVIATALGDASASSRQGQRMADALETLPRVLGEPVRSLVTVLVASERYGAPLVPALERLAAEVRATRRRRAEEASRRVSVKLLFPLVVCILPAFALLTVAPLIASALRSLRL